MPDLFEQENPTSEKHVGPPLRRWPMRRVSRSPFFWFLLFLAMLEGTATQLSPYRLQPSAEEAIRNPTQYRGYPEYLSVPRGAEPLVVWIGNSQGVAPEIDDSAATYPALLDRRLRGRWASARLENWSSGGLRTAELELLTIKAVSRRADLVVLCLSPQNFDHQRNLNLDFPQSDIPLLAGDPRLWRFFGDTLFAQNIELDDVLSRTLSLHSSLARSRIAVSDALAGRARLRWHPWLFGRRIYAGNRLDALKDPGTSIYWPRVHVGLLDWRVEYHGAPSVPTIGRGALSVRLQTFEAFIDHLVTRLAGTETELLFIWHPFQIDAAGPRTQEALRWFLEQASHHLELREIAHADLHAASADADFLSFSHLDEQGHRRLAERLQPLVFDALQ